MGGGRGRKGEVASGELRGKGRGKVVGWGQERGVEADKGAVGEELWSRGRGEGSRWWRMKEPRR